MLTSDYFMYLYLGNKYAKRGEGGTVRFMRHQAPQSTRPIITMVGRIKYNRLRVALSLLSLTYRIF